MSVMLTQTTFQAVMLNRYGALNTGVGVVVVVLLIVLLIERALVDAYGGPRQMERVHAFNAAIGPLLIVLAMLVGLRLVQALHLF